MKKHLTQTQGQMIKTFGNLFNMDGFTLIELLGVAAVIGVIAVLGINAYRQRTLNVKIDRATLEIQNILKAGSSFFLNQRKWPKPDEQTGDLFQKQYLVSDKALSNPWGGQYQYGPYSNVPVETEKMKLFQVGTIVPTEGIANQIAAKLSNAQVESMQNGYQVKAQILLAGGQQDKKRCQYLIDSFGTRALTRETETKSHLTQVQFRAPCPKGMKPGLLVGIKGIHTSEREGFETLWDFEVIEKQCHIQMCEFRVILRYYSAACKLSHFCWTKSKQLTANYIAYCEQTNP